jgi:hypothetical protein
MDASRANSRNPNKLSKEVYDEMKKTISIRRRSGCSDENSSKEPDGGEDAKAEKKDKSKRVLDPEDCGTKDKILKECAELFYHENFEQTLDEKTHLIGFNNGIFDLNKNQFRKASRRQVSMCTDIDYEVRAGDVLFDEINSCEGVCHRTFRQLHFRRRFTRRVLHLHWEWIEWKESKRLNSSRHLEGTAVNYRLRY